jgi:hypothetical protein
VIWNVIPFWLKIAPSSSPANVPVTAEESSVLSRVKESPTAGVKPVKSRRDPAGFYRHPFGAARPGADGGPAYV